jgi:hypothetical protein
MRFDFKLIVWLSVFWLIFSLIYVWEPHDHFYFLGFTRKIVAMAILPLAIFWGIWWVVVGFKKMPRKKHRI